MIHDEKISRQSLKRFWLLPLIVIVGVLAIVLGSLFYLNSRKTYQGKPASLTIGTPALETNALIYIAADMGYFERNGLKVTIKEYDSGGAAVSGLMRNEIDLAIASEFVMVNNLLQQHEIRTFGSIDRFENMFVIARKDRKIGKVADLKRRTIGVPLGTIAAFYLGRYLTLHGLGPADVTILNVRPDHSDDALAAGDVDAVVTWHPHLDRIMARYGDGVSRMANPEQPAHVLEHHRTRGLDGSAPGNDRPVSAFDFAGRRVRLPPPGRDQSGREKAARV